MWTRVKLLAILIIFYTIACAIYCNMSCVVAEEDDTFILEKRIKELEVELEGYQECKLDLSKARYDISKYKELAENCVNDKTGVKNK